MKKITKKIPKTPGVYFFKNGARKIIYIGKAANLKNRLSSYFRKNLEPRIAKMVVEAKTVSWKKTESAVDALILESALIKKSEWKTKNVSAGFGYNAISFFSISFIPVPKQSEYVTNFTVVSPELGMAKVSSIVL